MGYDRLLRKDKEGRETLYPVRKVAEKKGRPFCQLLKFLTGLIFPMAGRQDLAAILPIRHKKRSADMNKLDFIKVEKGVSR